MHDGNAAVTWDALFDDLTSGLESEWEYERAAREAERQRVRIAQLSRHTRLTALSAAHELLSVTLRDARVLTGEIVGTGTDWFALRGHTPVCLHLVPDHALVSVGASTDALRASIPHGDVENKQPSLSARMTFGYVARDLARRRVPVWVHASAGWKHHGTIDRAGADHLDLAVHDRDVPRRSTSVQTVHMVGFEHITSIMLEPTGLAGIAR